MMTSNSIAVSATFIAYFAPILGIGYYAYRRTADGTYCLLGGRSLGLWSTAILAGA